LAVKVSASVVECPPSFIVVVVTDAPAFADTLVFVPYEADALACAVPALAVAERPPLLALPGAAVALADALAE